MASRGFEYRVVSVGVNDSVGQNPLQFAESDAEQVFNTFTGVLGPATVGGSVRLFGANATVANLSAILGGLQYYPADYLLFYFSGHGGDDGIALADGIFQYEALHEALGGIETRSTLVILDACRSGTFGKFAEVGGIWESWAAILKQAMPGTRMFFATRPNENSHESADVWGGHFTWSLLQALHKGEGALHRNGHHFISDKEAFIEARQILLSRWPNDAAPQCNGLRGDFPMLLSQAQKPIGGAQINIHPHTNGFAANVAVNVYGRRGLGTAIHFRVLDAYNQLIDSGTIPMFPTEDVHPLQHRFVVDPDRLRNGQRNGVHPNAFRSVIWNVQVVEPFHNKVIGQNSVAFVA